jgi:hypothetical protein
LVQRSVPGVENRSGTQTVITRHLDTQTHISGHMRYLRQIKPPRVEAFIVCGERFSSNPIHPEDVIEVSSVITVGMNYWTRHVYPGQASGNHVDAGLFKHFSDGTVRRVLARFDDAGNRGPSLVVGAFDQKHLLIANDHSSDTWQPQWRVSDVPTKLNDEFGDRHNQVFSRDRDQGTPWQILLIDPRLDYSRGAIPLMNRSTSVALKS